MARYLFRCREDGTERRVISYKAVSSTNKTLVRFTVGAIALDRKFNLVYAAASYTDRAMVYRLDADGKTGATMCYYVYMGNPRRNAPQALAVEPGDTAEEPAGVYYASYDGAATTFFRASCGGDLKKDVVLRTFRSAYAAFDPLLLFRFSFPIYYYYHEVVSVPRSVLP